MSEKPLFDPPGVSVGLTDRMFDLFVAQGQPAEELALTVEKLAERLLWLEDREGLVGLSPEWQVTGADTGPTYWTLHGWIASHRPGSRGKGAFFARSLTDKADFADTLRDAMRAVERRVAEDRDRTKDILTGVGQKLSEGL